MSSIITLLLTKYSAGAIYNCLAINKLIGNLAHVHGLTKLPTTLNGNLFMNIICFSCMCYCLSERLLLLEYQEMSFCTLVMCDMKYFIYCLSQLLHTEFVTM